VIVFNKLWDVMKNKNISTYTLREKHNIDTRTIKRLKENENVTTNTLNNLCNILNCDIFEIIEYIPDKK